MKRIGVLTSGGDAPGMNAAIRAVVRTAVTLDLSVVGFKGGYESLFMRSANENDDYEMLTARSVSDRIQRGGTFLMTGRCHEFHDPAMQDLAISNLRGLGIEGLVCIGGDGTFHGAEALYNKGFLTVGVPGTIDNDLNYTDYTIGFDTAVNTACDAINRLRDTGDSHRRISLVTVMGRHSGDIATRTAFASGAELCVVPEKPWSLEEIAEKIKWGILRGKRSLIVVMAEGAVDSLTSDVAAILTKFPDLEGINPKKLSSSQIAQILEKLSGHETRATVLGYTQRGGTPTANDRILATELGCYAVQLLNLDIGGVAVGVRNGALVSVPFADVQKGIQPQDKVISDMFDIVSYMAR